MKQQKIFSAHKLIEYGFSSPQKRTSIIENALTPPMFIMDTMYPDIERATAQFLVSECTDATRLSDLDQTYQTREANSDHHEQRLLNALDAISHARSMSWEIPTDTDIKSAQGCPDTMEISGLVIRIKPSVVLKQHQSGYKLPFIGVAKPYFGKSFPLEVHENRERGVLFATLLHWYTEETLDFLGNADPSLCFVGDVFAERTHFAAKRHKQRRKQLEALAQEVCDRWDPIKNRIDDKKRERPSLNKR